MDVRQDRAVARSVASFGGKNLVTLATGLESQTETNLAVLGALVRKFTSEQPESGDLPQDERQ